MPKAPKGYIYKKYSVKQAILVVVRGQVAACFHSQTLDEPTLPILLVSPALHTNFLVCRSTTHGCSYPLSLFSVTFCSCRTDQVLALKGPSVFGSVVHGIDIGIGSQSTELTTWQLSREWWCQQWRIISKLSLKRIRYAFSDACISKGDARCNVPARLDPLTARWIYSSNDKNYPLQLPLLLELERRSRKNLYRVDIV